MFVKSHRVVANPGGGEVRIARGDRLDDAQVVGDRAPGPVGFVHRLAAHRPDVDEQPVGDVLEQAAVLKLQDALVEADIGLGLFVDMGACVFFLELRGQPPQRSDLRIRRAFGGQSCGHAFERRPDGDHLQNFLARLA